jgi:hypothetical protein
MNRTENIGRVMGSVVWVEREQVIVTGVQFDVAFKD